ncbi:hypothetical protein [Providencia sp. PROV236]|uniref:hypothetical protein n=1 Tax=Providencia sp. PROV236 TaxID=2936798 RepID=UPI0034E2B859
MAKKPKNIDETELGEQAAERQVELIAMHLNGIDADVHPNEVERWTNEGWQAK